MNQIARGGHLSVMVQGRTVETCAMVAVYGVAFASLYLLAGVLETHDSISLWNPLAALRLAALILVGWRVAPVLALIELFCVVVLGDADFWFPENDPDPLSFRVMGLTVSAMIPAAGYALGMYAASRLGLLDGRLATIRHVLGFYLAAAVAATLTGIGVCINLAAQGFLTVADLPTAVLELWRGDVIAVTTLTPFLIVMARWFRLHARRGDSVNRVLRRISWKREPFTIGFSLAIFVGIGFVVGESYESPLRWYPFFLPVIWLALCYGVAGAAAGILVVNLAIAGLAAASGFTDIIKDIQTFMIVLSGAGMLLAAAVQERNYERARLDSRITARTKSLHQEIDSRRRAEERAQAHAQRVEYYLTIAKMWVVNLDQRGRIIVINDEACEALGYTRRELLGSDWFAFWDPDETRSRARSAFLNLINSVNNTPDMRTIRFRGSVKTKSGRVRLVEWRSAFGFDPIEGQFLCLSSGLDITEKVAAERRAEYLATHDEVTGLPNRRWIMDEVPRSLTRAARRREKVAVLYLDLDGFKSVNDRFGHHVGDAVLSDVADTITATVRSADSVARVGGDEFVILLENVASTSAARSVGHKIIDTIAGLVVNAEIGACVGASIGLATYPDDATDAATLLQIADQAMYAAKRAGGSQIRSVSSPVLQ